MKKKLQDVLELTWKLVSNNIPINEEKILDYLEDLKGILSTIDENLEDLIDVLNKKEVDNMSLNQIISNLNELYDKNTLKDFTDTISKIKSKKNKSNKNKNAQCNLPLDKNISDENIIDTNN